MRAAGSFKFLASSVSPIPILQQRQHRVQFFDRAFQLADRIRGQILRRRQFVGVFKGLVLQPFEAVQLEVPLFDFRKGKAAPAVAAQVALVRQLQTFSVG